MRYSILALYLLALSQHTVAEPRPEFALAATVPGTSRVGVAASEAKAIITDVNKTPASVTISSELLLLSKVLTIVGNVANQFQTLGTTIVTSITTLASDSSGNVETLYTPAVEAVANAIKFADETLPTLTNPLQTLIGNALIEKFDDSLKHIGKALQALKVSLNELKPGALNAVADAGGNAITSTIVDKNLPRPMITRLVYALQLLRATVPVLKYTVDSTVDGIVIADQYMLALSNKVDNTIGEKSSIAADLDGIIGSIDKTITDTMTKIGTDLGSVQTTYVGLTNLATATSSPKLNIALGLFAPNLAELATKSPTILATLNMLKESIFDVYDVSSALYFIYDSYLVTELITVLIGNGDYSQYCFYKYKDYLFALLETVAIAARECVDKEIDRLEYFRNTVDKMLALLFFDFEDIAGDLTVCNGISDAANLEECVASLADIYTKLEAAFGDMFAYGYDLVSREVKAASNRLKICIRMSQSSLANTDIPFLKTQIIACATMGPDAEDN